MPTKLRTLQLFFLLYQPKTICEGTTDTSRGLEDLKKDRSTNNTRTESNDLGKLLEMKNFGDWTVLLCVAGWISEFQGWRTNVEMVFGVGWWW